MITNLAAKLLVFLLVFTLTVPYPLPLVLAQGQPGSPENASSKPGEGGEGGPTGMEGSPENASAAQAQATTDAETAASYGMDTVDVDATAQGIRDGDIAPGQVITESGETQSLSAGKAASEAIAAAAPYGGTDFIDKQATMDLYQSGNTQPGQVVGISGTRGTVEEVMAQEAAVAVGRAATGATIDQGRFGRESEGRGSRLGSLTAQELAEARMYVPISIPAWATPVNIMNVALTPNVKSAIEEANGKRAEVVNSAVTRSLGNVGFNEVDEGIEDSVTNYQRSVTDSLYDDRAESIASNREARSSVPTPTANPNSARETGNVYSYDASKGSFVDAKGNKAGVDDFYYGSIDDLNSLAKEIADNPGKTAVISESGRVTVTDTASGRVASFGISDINNPEAVTYSKTETEPVGQVFGQTYSGPKGVGSLNPAAQYAARVASNQQPAVAPTIDPDRAARAAAAMALQEDPDQIGQKMVIDIAASRAIARGKAMEEDLGSAAYQPIAKEIAMGLCNCSNPSKSDLSRGVSIAISDTTRAQQALDSIISKAEKNPNFNFNYEYAKAVIAGTQPLSAITKGGIGFNSFTNVPLTLSQGLGSQKTNNQVTALKADKNSITLRAGAHNEQTFGVRSDIKKADFSPQTAAFNPANLEKTDIPAGTYTPDRSGGFTTGIPAIDNAIAPFAGLVDRFSDWMDGKGFNVGFGGSFENMNQFPQTWGEGSNFCPPYPLECNEQPQESCLTGGNVPCNNQGGAVITAITGSVISNPLANWFTQKETEVSEPAITNKNAVTVLLTIDYQTGEIGIDRPDISASLENPELYYTEEQYNDLLELLEEEPLIFDGAGEIWYSNGLFSPNVIDGIEQTEKSIPDYVYLAQYIDEEGQPIVVEENTEVLPENMFTGMVRGLFQDSSSFDITDVSYITYRLIDPDSSIAYDEYYDYVVKLSNGDTRTALLPRYTSIRYMQGRFSEIGYRGDTMTLLAQAVEVWEAPEQNFGYKVLGIITDLFKQFVGLTGDDTEYTNTDLPKVISETSVADIERIFIYPEAITNCAEVTDGSNAGFMYVVVLKNTLAPEYQTVVTDGRCGLGGVDDWVTEIASHLESKYGVNGVTYDTIISKSFIRPDEITLVPGLDTVLTVKETVTGPIAEENLPEATEEQPKESSYLPNLTNTISFEVKVVNSNGSTVQDWSGSNVSIGSGEQIYFRWSGTDYQQCLPFLNDNGNYALTVTNRAMVTGNTESEGYNVSERSEVYRLECGGQRNNEFGVDQKEIKVEMK